MINQSIAALAAYGLHCGLIQEEDRIYTINLLLDLLRLDDYEESSDIPQSEKLSLEMILSDICDYAYEQGIIEDNGVVYRDLFDTRIMNCLVPNPSEVIHTFRKKYENSPKEATDYYYKLSQDSDYIRRYRIEKDIKWVAETEYGSIDITINLSKPEKDPKAIAAAGRAKQSGYPKCLLCIENEGYAGRMNHPARENHPYDSLY